MMNQDFILDWKKIGESALISHFSSSLDGGKIYVKKILPKLNEAKQMTFFLFHDLTSYHGRFENLMTQLSASFPGAEFVLMDFVGHGLSSGTRGHIENIHHLSHDMSTLCELINKEESTELVHDEWVFWGHGLGALVIIDFFNRFNEKLANKIDRIIISNFALEFNSNRTLLSKNIFNNDFLNHNFGHLEMMNKMRAMEIYYPKELLKNPGAQNQYSMDPLIVKNPTRISIKSVHEKVKEIYHEAYFINKPILVLESESPYVSCEKSQLFLKGLKKTILTKKSYTNLLHDLYNEEETQLVVKDVKEWLR